MRKTPCGIVIVLVLLVLSASLQAQEGTVAPRDAATDTPQVSRKLLAEHGFSFDSQKQRMCTIGGPEGPCQVEAFVWGVLSVDKNAHKCNKLDNASYVGRCVNGKLDGFSIVIADGSTKVSREAFISYFLEGRIARPVLTSYLKDTLNFGVQEERWSYGCVYFGKWDHARDRCGQFIDIYGADIITEANAQKLRDGTFDLDHYRSKFLEFLQRK